jgi:antitoxin MazE
MYIQGASRTRQMKVAKWGNSLAVRLPASLAFELGLKEGDQIDLVRNSDGSYEVSSDEARMRAIENRRARNWVPILPDSFFNEP